jgi:hypothetical protein
VSAFDYLKNNSKLDRSKKKKCLETFCFLFPFSVEDAELALVNAAAACPVGRIVGVGPTLIFDLPTI